MNKAYDKEFCEGKWDDVDDETMKEVGQEAEDVIEMLNKYTKILMDNNDKMSEIMLENYSMIDPEDSDAFQKFLLHRVRETVEVGEEKRLSSPHSIRRHLEHIEFYNSEFAERIQKNSQRRPPNSTSGETRARWSSLPLTNQTIVRQR